MTQLTPLSSPQKYIQIEEEIAAREEGRREETCWLSPNFVIFSGISGLAIRQYLLSLKLFYIPLHPTILEVMLLFLFSVVLFCLFFCMPMNT